MKLLSIRTILPGLIGFALLAMPMRAAAADHDRPDGRPVRVWQVEHHDRDDYEHEPRGNAWGWWHHHRDNDRHYDRDERGYGHSWWREREHEHHEHEEHERERGDADRYRGAPPSWYYNGRWNPVAQVRPPVNGYRYPMTAGPPSYGYARPYGATRYTGNRYGTGTMGGLLGSLFGSGRVP